MSSSYLVCEEKCDDFNTAAASVYVISQEKVSGFRRESKEIENSQQVEKLKAKLQSERKNGIIPDNIQRNV